MPTDGLDTTSFSLPVLFTGTTDWCDVAMRYSSVLSDSVVLITARTAIYCWSIRSRVMAVSMQRFSHISPSNRVLLVGRS